MIVAKMRVTLHFTDLNLVPLLGALWIEMQLPIDYEPSGGRLPSQLWTNNQ